MKGIQKRLLEACNRSACRAVALEEVEDELTRSVAGQSVRQIQV
jgi:hypothetical protein